MGQYDDLFEPARPNPALAVRLNADANPDQEAEYLKLAKRYKVPTPLVQTFPDEYKARAKADDVDEITRPAPKLRGWLSESTNAKLALDDVSPLTEIEQAVKRYGELKAWSGPEPTAVNVLKGLAKSFPQGFNAMKAGLDVQMADFLESVGLVTPDPIYKADRERKLRQAMGASEFTTPDFESSTARGVYGGVSSLLRQLPGLAATIATRSPTPAMAALGIQTQGEAYGKYRARGATGGEAFVGAGGETLVELATEYLPSKYIADAFGNAPVRDFIVNFLKKEAPGEQVATLLQDAIDTAIANPDKTWAQYLQERPEAAYQTLVATLTQTGLMAGANSIVRSIAESGKGEAAEEDAKQLADLLKTAGSALLRERSPEQFRELMGQMSDGAVIHVDGAVLNQLAPEVLASLPESVRNEIATAAAIDTTVAIPVADVLTVAPGTPLEQVLVENARMTPDAESQASAKAAAESQANVLMQQAERVMQQAVDQEQARNDYETVRSMYAEQLKAAGRYRPAVAEAMPHFLASFFTAYGSRMGLSAVEMQARYPVRIAGAPSSAGQTVMGQAKEGEITVEGYHFSKEDRPVISTAMFGTGLQGSSREEYLNATDKRLSKRTYFYADKGTGIRPESGVGGRAHRAQLTNVYDSNRDPLGLKQGPGGKLGFESRVLDAGFSGYLDRLEGTQPGQVIMLGDQTFRPELLGPQSVIETGKRVPAMPVAEPQWTSYATGTPAEMQAQLERMQAKSSWQAYDMRVEGNALQYRKRQVLGQGLAGFDRFVGDATRVDLGDAHEFKAGEAVVVAALHGTTGDFTAFDPSMANIESDLGGGFYFTNSPADVGENYAGMGPDLTNKIQQEAERLESNDDLDPDDAMKIARDKWMANEGLTLPVWVKMTNPVVLGGSRETFLSYEESYDEETDEYGEPTGDLIKVIEALREVASDERYGDADIATTIGELMEKATDNGGLSASELIATAKLSEGLAYATDYESGGKLAPQEILRRAFGAAGFDGFIDQTVDEKFGSQSEGQRKYGKGMKGMDADTVHFIAFKPTQIKSRLGNRGTFDETRSNILEQQAGDLTDGQAGNRGGRYSSGGLAPLEGAPAIAGATGPDPRLVAVAERYAADNSITLRRQGVYATVDPERAARIAAAYDAMPHAPNDPAVREAYDNLIRQTIAQYLALKEAGYQFWFMDPAADPYQGNPWNAMRDLRANQSMAVFPTEAGFGTGGQVNIGLADPNGGPNIPPEAVLEALRVVGAEVEASAIFDSDTEPTLVVKLKKALTKEQGDFLSGLADQGAIAQRTDDDKGALFGPMAEKWGPFNPTYFVTPAGVRADAIANPLLADTGITWAYGSPDGEQRPVLANDLFRAVRDAFGHGMEGAGFRAQGEENAWQAHARLFTGSAVGAITSETRGQNSWLNYGPHGESNKTAKVEDTVFAEQKTGLMPEWTWAEGRVEDEQQVLKQADDITVNLPDPKPAQRWISKITTGLQRNPVAPRQWVLPMADGEFALLELTADYDYEKTAHILWVQASSRRSGVGTQAMKWLQDRAAEDGISLTLTPFDRGVQSRAALIKFYKGLGFKKQRRGSQDMIWRPEGVVEQQGTLEQGDDLLLGPDGKPLVVYHGTGAAFDKFEAPYRGIYFTASPDVADAYAERAAVKGGAANVVPAHLKLSNPRVVNMRGRAFSPKAFDKEIVLARTGGNDGLVFRNVDDAPYGNNPIKSDVYVVFDPKQVVSAISGEVLGQEPQQPRGTFNPATLELVLNPNANLSTFFHETGHFFLEVLADIASQPNAPAQIVEDMNTFLKWAGITGDETVGGADSALPLLGQAPAPEGVLADENGKPLVLYHGGLKFDKPALGKAGRDVLWLTPDASVAAGYADQYSARDGREIKAYNVVMRNPLDLRDDDVREAVFGEAGFPSDVALARDRALVDQAIAYAKANGYDGVIHPDSDVENRYHGGPVSYAVFSPEQMVKAAPTGDEQQYNLRGIELRQDPAAQPGPQMALNDDSAFKRWFGDSKVVDADGEPLVVYHGSPQGGFDEFDVGNVGVFFSSRYDIAASYAGAYDDVQLPEPGAEFYDENKGVYSTYLKIENPMVIQWGGKDWGDGPEGLRLDEWANRAKRAGHDGLVVENVVDSGWLAPGLVDDKGDGAVYVVFKPEQIKSASGNDGTFDANDPSILSQNGQPTPNAPPVQRKRTALETWNAMTLDQKRAAHERWAESIEQYVMEGKAPSVELQPLMRRFATWLKSVYGSIKQFLAARGQATSGPVLGQADDSEAQADAVYSEIANDQEMVDALEVYMVSGDPPEGALNDKLLDYINRLPPVPADSYLTFYRNQPRGARPWARGWSSWTINEDQTRYFGGRDFEVLKRKGVHGLDLNRLGEYRTRATGEYSQYGSQGEWLVLNESVFNQDPTAPAGPPMALNDDIRRVMDRMLATDEQIAQANEAAGLVPDLEADAAAAERLNKRSMADLKWQVRARDRAITKLRKEAAAIEKDIRQQATVEVDQTPEMRAKAALDALRVDPEHEVLVKQHKAARKEAEASARAEVKAALLAENPDAKGLIKGQLLAKNRRDIDNKVESAMIKWDQANPAPARRFSPTDADAATIADSFGFEGVGAMLQAIDAFGSRADAIDGLTQQRMLEEHGDLIDDRAIQQAANEAVHNEARARSLATELRTQREMLNPRADTGETNAKGQKITVNALVEAAKQFAAKVVGGTSVADLRGKAWQHTAAERRASKRWTEATSAGKTEEAVKAKQDQMLNHAAAKAALDAQAEARKILDFFKRVAKGSDEKVVKGGRDADIVNAARAVLAAYGMETGTTKRAADYLETVKTNDPDTHNAIAPLVDAAVQNAQPMAALTVDELRMLNEHIAALWYLAKRSRQSEVDGNLLDREDLADELFARMEALGIPDRVPGEGQAVTKAEERGLFLKQGIAFLRRVEQWAEGLDGKYGGPFLRYVFQPVKDAADRYRADRIAYRKKLQALVDNLAPVVGDSVIDAPELGYKFGTPGSTAGTAMNEILHAILHTGNPSNKRKLLLGRGWAAEDAEGNLDTSRWDAFTTRLANEGKLQPVHYDFVQGVWDLLEDTKPLAQKAHRDVFGRYFDEVTAEAFADPWGQARRGGYVPAQVDSALVKDNALKKLAEEENASMAFAFPQPAKGFTMSRVEGYNKPLKLDLRTLSQHLDKVLLFSHMSAPVRDVRKLLTDKKVSQPLTRIQPAALESMLQPWLQRSAQQIVETPIVGSGKWARIPGLVRARAGAALMFANVSNSIQQITGLSTAAVRVKPAHLMRAVAQYVAHPVKFSQAVWGASPYMDDRAKNEVAVMNEQMQDILIRPGVYERAQNWAMRHAYFMQTAIDNVLSPIVWAGAFNQGLAEGLSDSDAIKFADGTVRQTQGSTLPEDVSRFETGPAYARAFTQFVGYFNMMANTNGTALKQIADEVGLKKGAGRAFNVVMLGFMAPIWAAEAIAVAFRGGPDDEDDDGYLDDWLAAVFGFGTIKGLLAQIPVAGQFGVAAMNRFNGNPMDDRVSLSPAISLLESAVGAPESVYKAIVEDGSAQKAVRDVATLVSVATGVPVYGLARPVGYLSGIADDRIEPTGPVDFTRGLITGTASPDSKQR